MSYNSFHRMMKKKFQLTKEYFQICDLKRQHLPAQRASQPNSNQQCMASTQALRYKQHTYTSLHSCSKRTFGQEMKKHDLTGGVLLRERGFLALKAGE